MARAAAYTNGKAAEADLVALQKQIAVLKDDLANITTTLGDYGKHQSLSTLDTAKAQAESARVAALARLETLTAQASTQLEQLRAGAGSVASQADSFVKERPATAIGIAAGVGFAIGLLTARR